MGFFWVKLMGFSTYLAAVQAYTACTSANRPVKSCFCTIKHSRHFTLAPSWQQQLKALRATLCKRAQVETVDLRPACSNPYKMRQKSAVHTVLPIVRPVPKTPIKWTPKTPIKCT